jgi:hypothetical protein
MNKLLTICVSAALVVAWSMAAQAAVAVKFDPDTLIQSSPSSVGADVAGGRKVDQVDARRLHQPWATQPLHETFYNPAAPQTQPEAYNTYMNWRDSLGEGEGIAMFNSWFLDASIVRSWGEVIVIKPGTTVTGTAADGWNVRVIDSPYGLGGSSVQWWTTDPSKYINTVSDIGEFTITADLYWDLDGDGWDADDAPVLAGEEVRFWAGNLNGDDSEFYREDTQALYFDDEGWGTLSPDAGGPFSALYSSAAGDRGSGFEAALTVKASAIPEPASLIVWSLLGVVGVAYGWRRRRAA